MKYKIGILALLALTTNNATIGVPKPYLDKLETGGISEKEMGNFLEQGRAQRENSKPLIMHISDEDFPKSKKNNPAFKGIDSKRINQDEEKISREQNDKAQKSYLDKLKTGGISEEEMVNLLKQQPKKDAPTLKVINSKVRININK